MGRHCLRGGGRREGGKEGEGEGEISRREGGREGGREGEREGPTLKLETPSLAFLVIGNRARGHNDEDGGLGEGRERGRGGWVTRKGGVATRKTSVKQTLLPPSLPPSLPPGRPP